MIIIFLLLLTTYQAIAENTSNKFSVAGINNEVIVKSFLYRLQQAVNRNDKIFIASLVDYPIRVKINNKLVRIKGRSEFISKYFDIINKRIKLAICSQEYEKIFVSWQGVMIGLHGEVWISPNFDNSNELRISAINN